MKEIIILVVVLILVFVPNTFFKIYLRNSGEDLISLAKSLQNNIEKENSLIKEDAYKLKKEFYIKEKTWILIVDHDMLDEIEYEMEECVALYDLETKNEFISASNRLIDSIEDLSKIANAWIQV